MKTTKILQVSVLTKVALLTAVAFILSIFEFPLWFAPDFYKLDLSSSVTLLGAYCIGPLAGIIIAVLKTVLKILVVGSSTAFVGEYVDIIITILYVFPAAITYRNIKTRKNALLGMTLGIFSMTIIGCVLNYYLLIPIYARLIGLPVENIIFGVTLLNGCVSDLKTLVLFVTAPFNILKGLICSVVAFLCLNPFEKIMKVN